MSKHKSLKHNPVAKHLHKANNKPSVHNNGHRKPTSRYERKYEGKHQWLGLIIE